MYRTCKLINILRSLNISNINIYKLYIITIHCVYMCVSIYIYMCVYVSVCVCLANINDHIVFFIAGKLQMLFSLNNEFTHKSACKKAIHIKTIIAILLFIIMNRKYVILFVSPLG